MDDLLTQRGLEPLILTTRADAHEELARCILVRGQLEREIAMVPIWATSESELRIARNLHAQLCAIAIRLAHAHERLARAE